MPYSNCRYVSFRKGSEAKQLASTFVPLFQNTENDDKERGSSSQRHIWQLNRQLSLRKNPDLWSCSTKYCIKKFLGHTAQSPLTAQCKNRRQSCYQHFFVQIPRAKTSGITHSEDLNYSHLRYLSLSAWGVTNAHRVISMVAKTITWTSFNLPLRA